MCITTAFVHSPVNYVIKDNCSVVECVNSKQRDGQRHRLSVAYDTKCFGSSLRSLKFLDH